MPFSISLTEAQKLFPEYTVIEALSPSEQKAAFHVCDANGVSFCLKIIAPGYEMDRLKREILAMQRVRHRNVAKLVQYEFSSKASGARHFIVEEFIEGEDFADFIPRLQGFGREQVADMFAEICDGLDALHSAEIVHRDLKPHNIRVKPHGTPVIIDLGLARHLGLPDLTHTAEGARIGTPLYFAPEQFAGTKHDIDHRTDLFAVGIMLYESLVHQHPFYQSGMLLSQFADAVSTSNDYVQHVRFATLPDQWKALICRLLDKERARRPHTAAHVGKILRKIRSD